MTTDFLKEYESFQREVLARRPRTIVNYLPEIADFLRFLACADQTAEVIAGRLRDTDTAKLLAFLRRPTVAQRSPGPVQWNMRLSAVRSLYAYFGRLDLLSVNAALKIDRQRTFERPTVPLSLQELIALTASARTNSAPQYSARNVAIMQVLIHTALRVHEIVSLNIDSVDLDHYLLLSVRRKGGKALSAAINDVVAQALQDCLQARSTLHASEAEPALFLSDRGKRLSVRTVQELVKQHGLLAGIRQKVSPHLLRHSSATQLSSLGAPIGVVQEICGHASITTTQRYLHAGGEDRKRAVDALSAAWKDQLKRSGIEAGETIRLI